MKAVAFKAAFLETLARSAWAWIVAAQLLDQFLVAMDEAKTALNAGFAVESPSGACSSIQKLKFWSLRRMVAS
jgi:hypothetical protein